MNTALVKKPRLVEDPVPEARDNGLILELVLDGGWRFQDFPHVLARIALVSRQFAALARVVIKDHVMRCVGGSVCHQSLQGNGTLFLAPQWNKDPICSECVANSMVICSECKLYTYGETCGICQFMICDDCGRCANHMTYCRKCYYEEPTCDSCGCKNVVDLWEDGDDVKICDVCDSKFCQQGSKKCMFYLVDDQEVCWYCKRDQERDQDFRKKSLDEALNNFDLDIPIDSAPYRHYLKFGENFDDEVQFVYLVARARFLREYCNEPCDEILFSTKVTKNWLEDCVPCDDDWPWIVSDLTPAEWRATNPQYIECVNARQLTPLNFSE